MSRAAGFSPPLLRALLSSRRDTHTCAHAPQSRRHDTSRLAGAVWVSPSGPSTPSSRLLAASPDSLLLVPPAGRSPGKRLPQFHPFCTPHVGAVKGGRVESGRGASRPPRKAPPPSVQLSIPTEPHSCSRMACGVWGRAENPVGNRQASSRKPTFF